jgi:hypothetical protein
LFEIYLKKTTKKSDHFLGFSVGVERDEDDIEQGLK